MNLGRGRKERARREGSREASISRASIVKSMHVQLPPPCGAKGENVSLGGFPGSSTACVPIPLHTAAPCLLQPTSFSCIIF